MEDSGSFLFGYLVFGAICGFISLAIAVNKERRPVEGFVLGFVLSVIGIIIEMILPAAEVRTKTVYGLSKQIDRQNRKLKKCPYCAEMILAEALICRFCQRDQPQYEGVAIEREPNLFKNSMVK